MNFIAIICKLVAYCKTQERLEIQLYILYTSHIPMNKCHFCQTKTEPSYTDVETLTKYLSPRKKMLGRDRTGVCANHQRKLSAHIKHARFLALIPYVSYQGAV